MSLEWESESETGKQTQVREEGSEKEGDREEETKEVSSYQHHKKACLMAEYCFFIGSSKLIEREKVE